MNAELYNALKDAAQKINSLSKEYGKFALRKVSVLSADSPIEKLIQAGKDIELIASMVVSK